MCHHLLTNAANCNANNYNTTEVFSSYQHEYPRPYSDGALPHGYQSYIESPVHICLAVSGLHRQMIVLVS